MDRTSLDIVIVNWNSGHYLSECLRSIARGRRDGFVLSRVVVVDNASTDSSADGLVFDLPLVLIRNKENRGFARACNQGAGNSRADLLLFLNPDMVLYGDALDRAVSSLARPDCSQVGICGIQLVDRDGAIDCGCARFPTPMDFLKGMLGLTQLCPKMFPNHIMKGWDHLDSRRVDHVTGAFFLVRRPLFEAFHGFDERFFVYLEDLDFSYRAHWAGWSSYYLAEVQAFHQGGYTHERSDVTWIFHSLCSRLLYAFKHFPVAWAVILALGTFFLEPFLRLALALSKGSFHLIRDTVLGYLKLWSALPRMIRTVMKAE